jgi:Tol biopolymer transport system component
MSIVMRRTTHILTGLLIASVVLVLGVATANAEYGPGADPVSVDYARLEQGDDATTDADITPDGRYVVMQTRATNFFADDDPDPPGLLRRGGVFRYDRATRALALVADGDMYSQDDGTLALRGASSPSVSANGRYVAFSTAQKLVPQDTNDDVDVYVRDMDVPIGTDRQASAAYTLVSAKSGGDVPATFAPHDPPLTGRNPGADIWANTGISADGTRVVFRTSQTSDLPDHTGVDTPAGQVFVRDLATKTTTLITRAMAGGAPTGGATGPAVLSADGSTVVWVGGNAAPQTRFQPGENIDDTVHYYLWRRLDGAGGTRRITGMADVDDPACAPTTPVEPLPDVTGPCYGPLSSFEEDDTNLSTTPPAVSTDGYRIAFLTSGGKRPLAFNNSGLDLFLTDMHPGVTRKAGTVELTRDGIGSDPRGTAGIQAVAMAADGRHLVIATPRDVFLLGNLAPLGTFRSQATATELYVIDLQDKTIDRVMRAYYDDDASADAGLSPTISANGALVAFTSASGNLFYGDANGREDAFVATRQVPDQTKPPPDNDDPTPIVQEPDLDTSLKHRTDGDLDVTVRAPEAGTIVVTASSSIKKTRAAGRASSTKVVVATRTTKPKKKGKVKITLRLTSKYRKKLLAKSARLAATVNVSFAPTNAKHSPATDGPLSTAFTKPKKKSTPKKKTSTKKKSSSKKKTSTKKKSSSR